MIVVNFLILCKSIINYTKKDIDRGETPQKVYTLCSIIRDTFCLSYSIRKSNNLYLYFFDAHCAVKLIGSELRFLGSDERSQALLLNKAIDEFRERKPDRWVDSTPGIFVKYFAHYEFMLKDIIEPKPSPLIFIEYSNNTNRRTKNSSLKNILFESFYPNPFFILPLFCITEEYPNFIEKLNSIIHPLNFVAFPNLKKPQDKILYINFYLDSLE
ncbi:MAG: hypothetical protein GF311_14255 [Candidatus Lokiarchaeota archaeon]|nr:hypothetical protein [Candidatus Lokiarchaeota archaeon]